MSARRTSHVARCSFVLRGRVQGVGYRAWVETTALPLGLSGWVRNRFDGSVEAVFQGSSEKVAEMLRHCEEGPPAARVARVEVVAEVVGSFKGFEVRSTA
jgi:acylphosphatase